MSVLDALGRLGPTSIGSGVVVRFLSVCASAQLGLSSGNCVQKAMLMLESHCLVRYRQGTGRAA
jgi:hypothetical protein